MVIPCSCFRSHCRWAEYMCMNKKYVLVFWKNVIYVHTLPAFLIIWRNSVILLMMCLGRGELTGRLWAVSPGMAHIHNVAHDFVLLSTSIAGWIWNGGKGGGERAVPYAFVSVTVLQLFFHTWRSPPNSSGLLGLYLCRAEIPALGSSSPLPYLSGCLFCCLHFTALSHVLSLNIFFFFIVAVDRHWNIEGNLYLSFVYDLVRFTILLEA